eukprot:2997404-Rhodomonas_salina.2
MPSAGDSQLALPPAQYTGRSQANRHGQHAGIRTGPCWRQAGEALEFRHRAVPSPGLQLPCRHHRIPVAAAVGRWTHVLDDQRQPRRIPLACLREPHQPRRPVERHLTNRAQQRTLVHRPVSCYPDLVHRDCGRPHRVIHDCAILSAGRAGQNLLGNARPCAGQVINWLVVEHLLEVCALLTMRQIVAGRQPPGQELWTRAREEVKLRHDPRVARGQQTKALCRLCNSVDLDGWNNAQHHSSPRCRNLPDRFIHLRLRSHVISDRERDLDAESMGC